MKNSLKKLLGVLLVVGLATGCGCSKEEKKENTKVDNNDGAQSVIEDQVFEGLEFVNVGASNGVVTTIIINNTGVVYEGSKFSMKIMDENGNVLVELTDEVKTKMETGTTQTIETKTNADLSKATSIEYSIVR